MSRSRVAPMLAAFGTAAFACAGLVAMAGEAHAASVVYVRTTGTDVTGCGVTESQACANLGWAKGEALSRTGDVVIDVGAGTFTPTEETEEFFLTGSSSVSSLTVRGKGVGVTVLRPPQGTELFAPGTSILVLDTVTYDVTIADLTVEGDGQNDFAAIWDVSGHTLRLSNIRVTGVTGSPGSPSGAGQPGGPAVGVLDLGGNLVISRTRIDTVRGGSGGSNEGNGQGGLGGNAQAIGLQGGVRLAMDSSAISGIRGGDGGRGGARSGQGGPANVGIGISGGGQAAQVSDTTISKVTGGSPGLPGQGGTPGSPAQGVGVWLTGAAGEPASLRHLSLVANDVGVRLQHAKVTASLLANTDNCVPEVGYLDGGFNTSTDPASGGCFTEPTNLLGLDPAVLGSLEDNGGPTPTVALDGTSPAATAVRPAALCGGPTTPTVSDLGTDQRGPGFYRPAVNCAAGAYQPNALTRRPGTASGPRVPGEDDPSTPPAQTHGQPCGPVASRAKC